MMKNTSRLNIRCSEAQKAAMLEYAAAAELPLVDYVLAAALNRIGVKRKKTRSVLRESATAKRVQINIRCSESDRAALDAAAMSCAVNVSEYVIARALGERIKPPPPPPQWREFGPETLKELHQFGERLNNLAHSANAGQLVSQEELNAGMVELVDICEADPALFGWIEDALRREHTPARLLSPLHYGTMARVVNNLNQIRTAVGVALPARASAVIILMNDYMRAEADAVVRSRIGKDG